MTLSLSSVAGAPPLPLHYYYIAGGLGDVCACLVSHPFDTVKVRQQLSGELTSTTKVQSQFRVLLNTTRTIIAKEGAIGGLYVGLTASILRQATFSTLRHGGFATVCTMMALSTTNITTSPTTTTTTLLSSPTSHLPLPPLPPHPSTFVSLTQAIVGGTAVGAAAALLANPLDVVLIRMQSDRHWPLKQRRNYRHPFDAIWKITKTKGLERLWRGCGPTVLRASLVTTAQLPTYHTTKRLVLNAAPTLFSQGSNDSKLHVIASVASAAVASVVTCPVDVVKTRIINMQKVEGGKAYYSSALDCVVKTVRSEGFLGLFKGLVPTFLRLGPHTIVLWNVQEFCLRTFSS